MILAIAAALHGAQPMPGPPITAPPMPAPPTPGQPAPAQRVPLVSSQVAELRRADGQIVARAMVFVAGGPIQVRIQSAGLAPGQYGAHIHAVGRCKGPSFESAGPHWNPAGRQHGSQNPEGAHLGDLPNLEVGADGHGRVAFALPSGTLQALFDADGASIVIHAAPDDYRTDPAGNSGARIACAALTMPPE